MSVVSRIPAVYPSGKTQTKRGRCTIAQAKSLLGMV
jgi:hypothetical protein